MNVCYFCGTPYEGKAYRTSLCSSCGRELKICLSCRFYDSSAPHECREPQAERVVDKERANFCDYFEASGRSLKTGQDKADRAKKNLEDLFS